MAGATGATGRLLTGELLHRGHRVRALVRSPGRLPEAVRAHPNLAVTQASILDLDVASLAARVAGCDAVASCLGHTISLRGILGPPYRLVTEATRVLCAAIRANQPTRPVRFVLMNTAANRNRDLPERVSPAQSAALALLRLLVPPHRDNEQAAEYLRSRIGPDDPFVQWAAVRPDSLVDADAVTPWDTLPSPTRSALFNPGRTSRVNVAHFMAELMTDDRLWEHWRGRMPVIYNRELP